MAERIYLFYCLYVFNYIVLLTYFDTEKTLLDCEFKISTEISIMPMYKLTNILFKHVLNILSYILLPSVI